MFRIGPILQGKCPSCEIGQVFEKKGNLLKLRMPVMFEDCPHCGLHFEKEPGYFLGAMYVSYALSIAQTVAVYFILLLFDLSFFTVLGIVISALLLTSFVNYRYSRIVWIYFFTPKNGKYL